MTSRLGNQAKATWMIPNAHKMLTGALACDRTGCHSHHTREAEAPAKQHFAPRGGHLPSCRPDNQLFWALADFLVDAIRHLNPGVSARFVHRDRGRREQRVRERANRDSDQVGLRFELIEDRRPALGAERHTSLFALVVGVPNVLLEVAFDPEAGDREPRLVPKCASGAPLAGEAVTGGDTDRLALDRGA